MVGRWMVATVALSLAAACSVESEQLGDTPVRPEEVAFQGLCAAEDAARSGQVTEAGDIFFGRSHAYLHELADRVAQRDRAVAADLLEAKERVEAALRGEDGGAKELAGVLVNLQRTMRKAFRVVDLDSPGSWKRCR
jgi:hypothetical protein